MTTLYRRTTIVKLLNWQDLCISENLIRRQYVNLLIWSINLSFINYCGINQPLIINNVSRFDRIIIIRRRIYINLVRLNVYWCFRTRIVNWYRNRRFIRPYCIKLCCQVLLLGNWRKSTFIIFCFSARLRLYSLSSNLIIASRRVNSFMFQRIAIIINGLGVLIYHYRYRRIFRLCRRI